MAKAIPFCDCVECQFGQDPEIAAQKFVATEDKGGMFRVTRTATHKGQDASDWGKMGYNEIIAARAYGTMNITEIRLQVCGGCEAPMAFSDRTPGASYFGYVHTACGYSGEYR